MSEKSIIIIGAGVAGLSTGCYGQMNGYKTQIFELHTLPGGLCTSWKRKGYTVDGCLEWLVGSKKGSRFYSLWEELGAVQGKEMVDHDEFMRVVDTDGKALIVYTDIDRFEKHLNELSPQDAPLIKEICGAVRKLTNFDIAPSKPRELMNILDTLKSIPGILPYAGIFSKYSSMTTKELGKKFKDPFLQKMFPMIFDMDDFPAVGFLITLAWMNNKNAGYPIGGSLPFSQAIEKRYLDLGGSVHYCQRVVKILVQNNRAVGIKLENGEEHFADVIVSAADGHATIFDMLEGKYLNDEIRGYYDNLPIFEPLVLVSFGVARDLSEEPHHAAFVLDEPIELAGKKIRMLGVKHYGYDPTLSPQGKSLVEIMFTSSHKYWKDLMAVDTERYDAEKKQIASTIMTQLDRHFPGFSEQVEMVDVASPLTFERYTGNWQGSFEGWRLTPKTMAMTTTGKGMSKTLPRLENFYMVGQWVEPGGGLPSGLISGRALLQVLCHKGGKKFETLKP